MPGRVRSLLVLFSSVSICTASHWPAVRYNLQSVNRSRGRDWVAIRYPSQVREWSRMNVRRRRNVCRLCIV
ncbi:hypothetical protein OH77DRAFT_1431789 [Trametes cingulata]|nr:hypothetical protein OH77DRAFT_1431789 [Trametes cingulata]